MDSSLTSQLRLDIRNYVLAYLCSKGERLEPFVQTALMQLLVRVCKARVNALLGPIDALACSPMDAC